MARLRPEDETAMTVHHPSTLAAARASRVTCGGREDRRLDDRALGQAATR